jgi:hypothetical protein
MKNLLQNYYKPTPIKWRKLGDSILVIGTIISTTCLTEYEKAKEMFGIGDLKTLMLTAIVCTALGKIVTNFAVAETENQNNG